MGRRVAQLNLGQGKLVVMIERGDDIVIPNGSTVLEDGDVLVLKENQS
ncbi:MAG: TrkA C-terminal domain-containing protein [Clostridiales bacterium]|nr:TrkA C-terminal domain-containing protein [Clostridiales bacterium]